MQRALRTLQNTRLKKHTSTSRPTDTSAVQSRAESDGNCTFLEEGWLEFPMRLRLQIVSLRLGPT